MTPRMARIRFAAMAATLATRFRSHQHDRNRDPQHRSIIVIDLVGFGVRTDLAQLRARADLDTIVYEALRASGIPRAELVFEDRGDGMIIFFPATVSKAVLLHPFIPKLRVRLAVHNSAACAEGQIRVRLAVHAGEVVPGPHSWIGTDLNLTCRLVDSAPLREELVHQPHSDVVVAISEVIHQAVVRHGHRGTDTSSYRQVWVEAKEVTIRAWIHTPVGNVHPLVRKRSTFA